MDDKSVSLYRLKHKDTHKAGMILADAFQNDPVWKLLLKNFSISQRCGFFELPVKYCLKYGNACAPSENIEGVGAWTTDGFADMPILKSIRSWGLISTLKAFFSTGKIMKDLLSVFEPLSRDRKENMKGRHYLYFVILGVGTEFRKKGFGRKIIEGLIEESESSKLPVYLETSEDSNVKMYEKFGFNLIRKINLPVVNLPQWEMVRETES